MKEPQWLRSLRFEIKYLIKELVLLVKHPTRKATYRDISYHWYKIWDILIFHPWYCLKRGVRNIYNWGWEIWSLDSWDYSFLCNMIDHQLKDMEELWESKYVKKEREYEAKNKADGNNGEDHIGWRCQHRRIWKRIRWTRKLMQMWRDEHYTMQAYDVHSKLFPKDSNRLFDTDESLTTYDEYGVPILYTCKPMAEDARTDYRMRSEIAIEKDKKVFKLWQKNLGFIQNWWH